jgi:DNA-binding SARP family transcriptional activator
MNERVFVMQTSDRSSGVIAPLILADSQHLHQIPVPLARIFTCGMLTVEVLTEVVSLEPLRGRYEVLSTQMLRGRGAIPSLSLLKLLVGSPHRFASKDWLATQMQQEMEAGAVIRLDTSASYLRGLLCGLKREDSDALRRQIVAYLRNGHGSGPGYQLAPYPLIWLDRDALFFYVEQAARMERFGYGKEALSFWEQAYALASRGEYLPDEQYSKWAQEPREQVEGALRQSVHALRRLYLARDGEAAEEEVIQLLRSYWQTHKTDEDALRPLMELLGKHERYQEAEKYYQQCVVALDALEEGLRPDERTSDLREFLRTKLLFRQQEPQSLHKSPERLHLPPSQRVLLFSHLTHSIQDVSRGTSIHADHKEEGLQYISPGKRLSELGGARAGISGVAPTPDANFLADIERVLHRPICHLEEKDLTYLEQRTRYYWRDHRDAVIPPLDLMAHVVEQVQRVIALLERSLLPSVRTRLCAILSQNVLLIGLCFYDLGQYETARAYFQVAREAAREGNAHTLQALTWGWDSLAWSYGAPIEKRYEYALQSVLQANHWASLEADDAVQCWTQATLAEVYAHLNRKDECLATLAALRKRNGYSSGDFYHIHQFDACLLDGYQGACLQLLYLPGRPDTRSFLDDAEHILLDVLSASHGTATCSAFYTVDMARVQARKGEIGVACEYAKQTIEVLPSYPSASLQQRLVSLRLLLEPYKEVREVKDLKLSFAPSFLSASQPSA